MIHRLALVVVVATKTGVHKANNAGPDCTFTILFARCLSHQGFFRGRGQPPSLYICYTLLKIMGLDYTRVVKKTVRVNLWTIFLPYPSM